MALNEISGKEGEAVKFLRECLDGIDSEVDVADMMKVHLEYIKAFIDSFESAEIAPILTRVQKTRSAVPNTNIPAIKAKNTADYQAGARKPENIVLPTWPSVFKNPIMIQKIFGNISTATKSKKAISKTSDSKINGKILMASTHEQILYLIEYMMIFFMKEKEEDYYILYGKLMDKCKELGYVPKDRASAFAIKNQDVIARDIIGMFLYEDMLNKDNHEYMINCINRYHELYG